MDERDESYDTDSDSAYQLEALFDPAAHTQYTPRERPAVLIDRLSDDILREVFLRLPQFGAFFRTCRRFQQTVTDNVVVYFYRQHGKRALYHLMGYGSLCTVNAVDGVLAAGAVLSRYLVQALFSAYSNSGRMFFVQFHVYPWWGLHGSFPLDSYLHILRLAAVTYADPALLEDDYGRLLQAFHRRYDELTMPASSVGRPSSALLEMEELVLSEFPPSSRSHSKLRQNTKWHMEGLPLPSL
jgi:hypothetical protein